MPYLARTSHCSLWYASFLFHFVDLIIAKAPMYYRNANCAVVVYDITQSASLEKARNWIRELQRQADPSIVIALCGNKSDLAARRQVTQEEAQKYAQEEGLMWAETSAKSGEGVTDIFTRIGQSIPPSISSVALMTRPPLAAKKLPTTAPPASRSGPGRAGAAAGRTGVDLNKQQRPIASGDQCNC
jgi:Ras-related protein Rab-5C